MTDFQSIAAIDGLEVRHTRRVNHPG